MPFLKIQSNSTISNHMELLAKSSALVAEILGKPEKYVMVSLEENPSMLFGGSKDPLLYCELKSIGLPQEQTKEISAGLCNFLSKETGISIDRIYIEFANAERAMWGWNGTTFER